MPEVQEIKIRDSAARAEPAAKVLPRPPAEDLQDMQGEKMVLNMGPSHPPTHGVLRIVLELDGEIITKAVPDVGYLHRGDKKIAENMTSTQFIPYTDRLAVAEQRVGEMQAQRGVVRRGARRLAV